MLFVFAESPISSISFFRNASGFQGSLAESEDSSPNRNIRLVLPRKEVIHPHVPVGIPCYDFTPIIGPTLDGWLLTVTPPASGVTNFRGVTGGVYKARERIHRSMLTCDY